MAAESHLLKFKVACFILFTSLFQCGNYDRLSNSVYFVISFEQGVRDSLKWKDQYLNSIPPTNLFFDSIKTKYIFRTSGKNGKDISYTFGINYNGNIKYLNSHKIVFGEFIYGCVFSSGYYYEGMILPFIDTVSIRFNLDTLIILNKNNGYKLKLLKNNGS